MARRLLGEMKKRGGIHWACVKKEGNGVSAAERQD